MLPDNYPLDDCPLIIAPGQLPQRHCSLTISPWKLPPRKIAFRMICRIHNCPRTNGAEENCPPPLEICPRDKFYPRIRKLSTFNQKRFKLYFDFCITKNIINTVRLKPLKKEQQFKNNGMEYGIVAWCFIDIKRFVL